MRCRQVDFRRLVKNKPLTPFSEVPNPHAASNTDSVAVQPHRRLFLVSLSYINADKFHIYPELLYS